ncbi:hypothetical protein IV500_08350 [Paeniglutamicibacter antarcticus]|uniref:Uncharacterized protein n=1 Tax=Arthrobacter terrae TaxID=2935737 RepID=A0A931CPZ8_9MICC|nr:hypothetical protein [Arthrobacter terrae]MBG0739399.1 hypothetical protein [Arthrobacter terrae]
MPNNKPTRRDEADPAKRAVHRRRGIGRCYTEPVLSDPGQGHDRRGGCPPHLYWLGRGAVRFVREDLVLGIDHLRRLFL